jgi:hypothetical protein
MITVGVHDLHGPLRYVEISAWADGVDGLIHRVGVGVEADGVDEELFRVEGVDQPIQLAQPNCTMEPDGTCPCAMAPISSRASVMMSMTL